MQLPNPLKKYPLQSIANLTPREKEIRILLFEGLTNQEMSIRLGIKEESVKNALSRLFAKFHVHSRSLLLLKFIEQPVTNYKL